MISLLIYRGENTKELIKNELAQAGVGRLIIFIATVLVAAVAATVLIQTSGVVQSKSAGTTKEAASAVGENLAVEAVDGYKSSPSSTTLQFLNITIRVAAGGSEVDLSKVLLKVQTQNYNYSVSSVSANTFRVYVLRQEGIDLGNSTNAYSDKDNPVLKVGALARIDAGVSGLTLAQKTSITIALTPEKGTTFNLPLTLPAFGSTNSVPIYP